jgi:hypothetical protein
MFEERKNWVWWTCMCLPSQLLCSCENLMFRIELFQNFLTDFVLQSFELNKIVLVVESTDFCNIIMLLLAQWLSLARICMFICNAMLFDDLVNKVVIQSPWKVDACQCFMAKRTEFFLQELINASRWFSSDFWSLPRISYLRQLFDISIFTPYSEQSQIDFHTTKPCHR